MTINEYQGLAMRTSNRELSKEDHLLNGVLGLVGESGEIADLPRETGAQLQMWKRHQAPEMGRKQNCR